MVMQDCRATRGCKETFDGGKWKKGLNGVFQPEPHVVPDWSRNNE
jgi:hypothetical protein